MLEKMIVTLIKTKPFYAHFIQQMNRIETTRVPTLGVNITERINLFFNPKFLEGLKHPERVACLEHEVLHLLNLHLFRSREKNAWIFNIACDLAINSFIENLPETTLSAGQFGLEDGKTAEWYYNELVKEEKEVERALLRAGAGILDDHELWKDSRENAEFQEEFLRRAIKLSLSETQDYGSLPGNLQEDLAKFLEKSPINWRRCLERFLIRATILKPRRSRTRPNRRFEDEPGQKVEEKLRLLIGLDTSGSVTERELSLFFSEIEKIKALGMEITVAECDTRIGNVYRYRTRPKSVSGRGGTSFQPVFELAEKKRPDALLYLTDGYGEYPKRSSVPTLWCLTSDGNFSGTFGRVLKLPKSSGPN